MIDRATKRAAARVAAVLLFLVLAGATYQGVATALERRTFPRPGGMVSVGDHQLHIYCLGDGAPTVVLEAPVAGTSSAWASVQPGVARVTRVCAYDRAGLGWSERGDRPFEPAAVVDELHTLLAQAGERAPFVVAGQGLGAAFARLFASRFGGETAAVILVDDVSETGRPTQPSLLVDYPATLPWLARTGILRMSGGLCSMTAGVPEPSGGALCAFLNRPDHLSRTAEELSRWEAATTLASATQITARIPVSRVDVIADGRVAFLRPSQAAPVVTAIQAAIRRARQAVSDAPPVDATTDVP